MSNPINVNGEKDFKNEVLLSDSPVLVDFWAPWCGPCQMMAPVLEELAKEFEGKLKVVKIDTEQIENQNLAIQYNIQSIPNMKLFKAGAVIQDFVGFRPITIFEEELKQFINK